MLDTEACRFDAVSDRAVRVSGMRWLPADTYTVKLEGVERAGYRAITICGTRDPLLIAGLDAFLASVRRNVEQKAADFGATPDRYRLIIRSYGRDGVMGAREPVREIAQPRARLCRRGGRRRSGNRQCRGRDRPHQHAAHRFSRAPLP